MQVIGSRGSRENDFDQGKVRWFEKMARNYRRNQGDNLTSEFDSKMLNEGQEFKIKVACAEGDKNYDNLKESFPQRPIIFIMVDCDEENFWEKL